MDEHEVPTTTYSGQDVIDEEGNKLGTVTDVVSDSSTLEPQWLVVDVGVIKGDRYVPVSGSYRSTKGHIVVPYTREMVKHAPKAHRDHVPTVESERELREFYGINS
jgi:sporulation protein YlmC with PRC-barrel domain